MQTDLDGTGKTESSPGLSGETLFQPVVLAAEDSFLSFPRDVFNAKFQGLLSGPRDNGKALIYYEMFLCQGKICSLCCLILRFVIHKGNICLFLSFEVPLKIREFQNLIGEVYRSRDEKRGADKTFLWFLEEVGELTRSYRRGEKENVGKEMADVFAWLASMANLLHVDLESEVQKKYPKVCPLCSSSPCRCPWV